jgi:hypothetical protein
MRDGIMELVRASGVVVKVLRSCRRKKPKKHGINVRHKHLAKHQIKTFGILPKDNTPEPTGFRGTAYFCSCGKIFFQPDDKRLSRVEVEIVQ